MPVMRLQPSKIYLRIINQLTGLIEAGEFRPGDRLPTERDLARQLGVSRVPVREALVAMELMGAVEAKVGDGWYVRGIPTRWKDDGEVEPTPSDILDARIVVESDTAHRAAELADTDSQEAIHQAIVDMERALQEGRDPTPADRDFHTTIARATGNSVLASLVAHLWRLQGLGLYHKFDHLSGNIRNRYMRYLDEHKTIYAALVAGNPRRARSEMRRHLKGVLRDFSSPWRP
jgi:GntR family uxuAB operon transcriptional repressor